MRILTIAAGAPTAGWDLPRVSTIASTLALRLVIPDQLGPTQKKLIYLTVLQPEIEHPSQRTSVGSHASPI
jgi:hypothetical protein